jgi:hypothetical protein
MRAFSLAPEQAAEYQYLKDLHNYKNEKALPTGSDQ